MHKQTKILRLKDGEDIMTSFIETSNHMLILENPMTVFFKRLSGSKSMVMMSPWLPIELVKENIVEIYSHDVLTSFEPKESLIEYYNNAVEEVIEVMQQSEHMINDALTNDLTNELTDEELEDGILDDLDEEIKAALEQSVPGTKRKLIH